METSTQRRRGIGPFDAERVLDAEHLGHGDAGHVLIVNDDAAVRPVRAADPKGEGLHVLEAEDVLDALAQARCERPDLVLTDVTIPGHDSFQLAEGLRRPEPTNRIRQ